MKPGLPPRDVTDWYRYRAGGHDAQEVLFDKHGLAAVLLLLALVWLLAVFGAVAFRAEVEALALGSRELRVRAVTRAVGAAATRAFGLMLTGAGWRRHPWRELSLGSWLEPAAGRVRKAVAL